MVCILKTLGQCVIQSFVLLLFDWEDGTTRGWGRDCPRGLASVGVDVKDLTVRSGLRQPKVTIALLLSKTKWDRECQTEYK